MGIVSKQHSIATRHGHLVLITATCNWMMSETQWLPVKAK
jgi:hypothetical protein